MLTAINQSVGTLRRRLAKEQSGFTLIELLVVLVIIGVLLAIAVPSYLGFKKRAEKSAAQSNVRAAIPAMEAFYSDNGTYVGATLASLRAIDSGLASVTISGLSTTAYTISFTQGSCWGSITGPGGSISTNC
jgi:type IV pilus assembly protein PilA